MSAPNESTDRDMQIDRYMDKGGDKEGEKI